MPDASLSFLQSAVVFFMLKVQDETFINDLTELDINAEYYQSVVSYYKKMVAEKTEKEWHFICYILYRSLAETYKTLNNFRPPENFEENQQPYDEFFMGEFKKMKELEIEDNNASAKIIMQIFLNFLRKYQDTMMEVKGGFWFKFFHGHSTEFKNFKNEVTTIFDALPTVELETCPCLKDNRKLIISMVFPKAYSAKGNLIN